MKFEKNTIECVIKTICRQYASREAVRLDEQSITYAGLYQHVVNMAANLKKLGIRRNDKVAIILPNCFEYIYIYFALFLIGAWAAPISTKWEAGEIKNVLVDSDAKAIIYQDRIGIFNYTEILTALKDQLPLCESLICKSHETPPGHIPLDELIHGDIDPCFKADRVDEEVLPDDVALLAYTSGTTGTPKGVMIPHKNLVLTSKYTADILFDEDAVFSVAPLYAAQGFLAVLIYLVGGLTMKWNSNFNPNDILGGLATSPVQSFHTQPTMWNLLLSQAYFKYLKFDHLKKVIVSGSLCSYDLARKIEKEMNCTLFNVYGLIEATGVVTSTRREDSADVRLNTVGTPIPGVEIKIVDKNRLEVEPGQVGELAVRGYVMKGYYKNEKKTREVIDADGWLYTGDLACLHEDGKTVRIVGRHKDMIIRGGFNVYPIDIEECLLKYDKIDDISVVGKNDGLLGESLVAFVIPKAGAQITEGDIKRFCRGKIAGYKIPDEVEFVSQFPILLSGKIQKNILRQWAEEGAPEANRLFFNNQMLSLG